MQPVTLAYTHQNGMPIGHANRARFAWFGDMPLVGHFWSIVRAGRLTGEVRFHTPVEAACFASRKALAAHCFEVIGAGWKPRFAVPPPLDEVGAHTHNRDAAQWASLQRARPGALRRDGPPAAMTAAHQGSSRAAPFA